MWKSPASWSLVTPHQAYAKHLRKQADKTSSHFPAWSGTPGNKKTTKETIRVIGKIECTKAEEAIDSPCSPSREIVLCWGYENPFTAGCIKTANLWINLSGIVSANNGMKMKIKKRHLLKIHKNPLCDGHVNELPICLDFAVMSTRKLHWFWWAFWLLLEWTCEIKTSARGAAGRSASESEKRRDKLL